MAFWNDSLLKVELVKREISLLALCWLRVEAIEERQKKNCSRWGREVGFEREGVVRGNGAGAVEDVFGVHCGEGESGLVVVDGVWAEEETVVVRSAEGAGREAEEGSILVPLSV